MASASLAKVISLDSARALAAAQRSARRRREARKEAMLRHPSFASRRRTVVQGRDTSSRG